MQWGTRVLRSLTDQPTLSKPDPWREVPYPFVYGTHDAQLLPTEDFRECCVRSLARSQLPNWTPDFETDDVPDLVEQIRTRLLPKRGVFARQRRDPRHRRRAARLLPASPKPCSTSRRAVGFEEPGYPHARNTFSLRTSQISRTSRSTKRAGGRVAARARLRLRHPVAPEPDHRTLSLERRQWLLRKAALQDFVVIEDDYEAENLYAGEPTPALKSLDKTGRVIYIGSMSKSLVARPATRLHRGAEGTGERTARAAPRHGAAPQRLPAACVRALPLPRPPRLARAPREPGAAPAHGRRHEGAGRPHPRIRMHAAQGARRYG